MFTEFCETSYSNALGSQLELLGHLGIVYHFKDNHLNQKLYCARLFMKRFFENCIAESPKKNGLRSDEILQYTGIFYCLKPCRLKVLTCLPVMITNLVIMKTA